MRKRKESSAGLPSSPFSDNSVPYLGAVSASFNVFPGTKLYPALDPVLEELAPLIERVALLYNRGNMDAARGAFAELFFKIKQQKVEL